MKVQNPIKQHIVPQVYLKRFIASDDNGFFYKLRVKPLEWERHLIKKVSPSQVCYIEDFYTIETEDTLRTHGISDRYFIEKNSFPYENSFLNEIMNKIATKKQIRWSDAEKFVEMLLSIKSRNVNFQKGFLDKNRMLKIGSKYVKILRQVETKHKVNLKKKGIPPVADKVEHLLLENLNNEQYVNDIYRKRFLEEVGENNEKYEQKLAKQLSQWSFFIFHTNTAYPFICSDNPGGVFTKQERAYSIGFNDDFHSFFFPLSPQHLFVLTLGHKDKRRRFFKEINHRVAEKPLIDNFNKAAFALCNENVFATDRVTLERVREMLLACKKS